MNSQSKQITTDSLSNIGPSHNDVIKKTKLFRNRTLALQIEFPQKTIPVEKIINLINYAHFFSERIFLHLQCNETDYLAKILPEPTDSEQINLRWMYPFPGFKFDGYETKNLVIPKDNSLIIVPATEVKRTAELISIRSVREGCVIGQRGMQRHYCPDAMVEIRQDQSVVYGEVIDFNALFSRVRTRPGSFAGISEIDIEKDIQLTIKKNNIVYFSGVGRISKTFHNKLTQELVLSHSDRSEPAEERGNRMRNPRLKLSPSPIAAIKHPFIKDSFERDIVDLSNNGFLIREKKEDSVLIPGLIIPELVIRYAGVLDIPCQARVIYRRDDGDYFLYGTAILDMTVQNHSLLTSFIFNQIDPNAFISKRVNLDALWEFFFETGFIYPKKYNLIGAGRENFKRTYKKLYEDCPEIARHFTYERDGRIYGHISMVKAYSRTWLLHHLAARPMDGKAVGLQSLKQVIHYLYGLHELPSMRSDYILAFYQPQNRFAERAYGGFTRWVGNIKKSSQDLFFYLTYPLEKMKILPREYSLEESSGPDIAELDHCYQSMSGGLLLDAMGITNRCMVDYTLQDLYFRSGLKRSCRMFSLKRGDRLLAVLIQEESDSGLNLSELLNGIKIFILDIAIEWEILSSAISMLANKNRETALFIYPEQYAPTVPIKSKQYQFWILNIEDGYDYKEYMAKYFRIRF
jgi:hypothetical protein